MLVDQQIIPFGVLHILLKNLSLEKQEHLIYVLKYFIQLDIDLEQIFIIFHYLINNEVVQNYIDRSPPVGEAINMDQRIFIFKLIRKNIQDDTFKKIGWILHPLIETFCTHLSNQSHLCRRLFSWKNCIV